MIPRTHADAISLARLTVSEMGGLILPYVTGMFRQMEGESRVRVGLQGAADTIACYRGQFYAIECKVGRDIWRPEQQSFAKAVEAAGGKYILARWHGLENGVETIRHALGWTAEQPIGTTRAGICPSCHDECFAGEACTERACPMVQHAR